MTLFELELKPPKETKLGMTQALLFCPLEGGYMAFPFLNVTLSDSFVGKNFGFLSKTPRITTPKSAVSTNPNPPPHP